MVLARDFFDNIHKFLHLAEKLELSADEELALLSISDADWQNWRAFAVASGTKVPPLLERRMDYALQLLERMAANHVTGAASAS